MTRYGARRLVALAASLAVTPALAGDFKADLSGEQPGHPPTVFEPLVGSWTIAQDGPDKVVQVDGSPWKASQDNPTRLLVDSARRLYGVSNEELMDNAKQFAYFPVALLKGVDSFSDGTIRVRFKTVAGDLDRCSGILFNVKPSGDWLAVRYNDTEHNIVLWEFHNGRRRFVKRTHEGEFALDRSAWHELRLTVEGASIRAWIDDQLALDYTLGSEPGPGRNGSAPHGDLFPANNPVLRPPVSGRVGLWSKTDSTSAFKDYVVTTSSK
jgi:hypothetical protein